MLTTKNKAKALAMAKEIGDKVRVEEITPKPKRRKRRQHPAITPARCRARLSAAAVFTTTAAARLAILLTARCMAGISLITVAYISGCSDSVTVIGFHGSVSNC
ncbi:hypothetical protein [Mesorhizobium sp. M1406]|uniref:hypothetical protein n=1 Tax=Mesorhizobium sp. M1406 TaxID=2957099 RepID=UPI0033352D05